MQSLIILREELICFVIILYLLANNLIYGTHQQRNAFTDMSIFAAGHVLFDIVTVYSVNHLDMFWEPVNHVFHLIFYLFGALFSIEFFHYAFSMVYPAAAEKITREKKFRIYLVFSTVYLVAFSFIPIKYTQGDGTCYSDGPAAITAFFIPLFFITVTTVLLIVKRRDLERGALAALLPMLGFMFAADIAEIFWTEILISGGALTLVTLGVYFSLENPRLFKTLRRAEASDRAKSYFLASMSHEIRTPLNAVIGFSELLRNEKLDAATQHDYLKGIADSGRALLDMVNDVLDLSKLEAGQMVFTPVETDVGELVLKTGAIFAQQRQAKGLEAFYELDVSPLVALDKLRFRQILINLIGNALKFTHRGSVTVSARFTQDTQREGALVLSVKDTGIGIPEEDRDAIFQPFIQSSSMRGTHAANQGTGLGLAIIKRMVNQMGGDIVLKSEPGKGSEFIVTLPHLKFVPKTDAPDAAKTENVSTAPLNARILLVDDVAVNLKVTEAMCRKLGIASVVAAQSCADALAALDKCGFDLILTDIWMPDMNGTALAQEIRKKQNCADVPIIALTADIEAASSFRHDVFSGILLKPITLESLRKAITLGLEKKGQPRPTVKF